MEEFEGEEPGRNRADTEPPFLEDLNTEQEAEEEFFDAQQEPTPPAPTAEPIVDVEPPVAEEVRRKISSASSKGEPSAVEEIDESNMYAGRLRKYGEEDPSNPNWVKHEKHFFILSSAGKPIYTKYGNESKLSSFMGIVQALISFLQDDDDSLRSIIAGDFKFVFLLKGNVYLLAVANTSESEVQLRDQLAYLYSHIVSVLTQGSLTRIFQQRNNFDLRNLLGGADITFLDQLCRVMDRNASYLLGAIQCLRLEANLRSTIGNALVSSKVPEMLYAILFSNHKLITLLRPRRHSLHPSDLHLLFNMVKNSSAFRAGESWTPICLPKFDNSAFLYAHVSFIDEEVCLVLISAKKDAFFEMSTAKNKIVSTLTANGALTQLAKAIQTEAYSIREINIAGLRHFIYKSKSTVQFTTPMLEAPYVDGPEQKRLVRLYQHVHHRTHLRSRSLKIHFMVAKSEIILAWIASGFELYAAFGPLVTKNVAIQSVNHLLRWIKREEENLFILNSPVF
eukprot:Lithocolla_globosa_v1_NODE_75_length_6869_cov_16.602289.p3 type:complete len:508 gc:universal NODE_75_length_6869_cov_16.602289:1667-144(-)